jgi:serine/threonine-protein kinase
MYDTRRSRRGRGFGFWILALLGLAAAGIGGFLIYQFVFAGGTTSKVQVPNLDGLTVEAATTTLQQYELRLGAQTPATSDRPQGTVIAQQPAAGESIETNQSVNVTVSKGKEQATVPQLVALTSVEDARIALQDANLVLGTVKEKNSSQPAGYVLSQTPAEGTQIDAGASVNITVSSGLVKVPNVKGSSEAQAQSDLAQVGFDVQVVEIEDGSVSAGTVLAQSPQAGELLARGSTVTITVAKTPAPTPTPTPSPTPVAPTPTPLPSDSTVFVPSASPAA